MSHQHHDIFENRKQFQLERMILFSDAVFAIAITLLAIEVRLPEFHVERVNALMLKTAIIDIWPQFLSLFMSFAVIGLFWVQHHRLFGLVTDFDRNLLWLNLLTLFFIILVPFSSVMNRYAYEDFAWQWYSLNMTCIGLAMFLLWNYIGSPKRKLSVLADDPVRRKYAKVRSLTVAFIFLLGFLLCLPGWEVTSTIARFVYCLIFPLMMIISRRYDRLAKKNNPA